MKKIAIVGSTSAVGLYLKKELEKDNCIVTVGRKNADIYYDLRQPLEELSLPCDIDVIVCLSAVINADNDGDVLNLMETNVMGALKLCMKAHQAGIKKVVFVSSIYAIFQPENNYYGYYSLSKQCAEKILTLYCEKNGIDLCILKPSQIYGDNEMFKKNQPLLYAFVDRARCNEDITIYGKNDALRNYIYIDDVISVIKGVIEKEIAGEFSVVNPVNIRVSEIAKAAIQACGSLSKVAFLKDKPSISDNPFQFDNQIYELLGIKHFVDIDEGMHRIVANLEKNNEMRK